MAIGAYIGVRLNRHAVFLCLYLVASSAIAAEPAGLRDAIAGHLRAQAAPAYKFKYALTDLNGDGVPDAVVLLQGDYCGSGGCTLQIYRGTKHGFEFVSSSTISHEPIRVLSERRFGWRSFTTFVSGGGAKPCDALMRFNGKKYPRNPSLVACAPSAVLQSAVTLKLTQ